jgi:DNA invertase Pin-like site-specific DNA recombinase
MLIGYARVSTTGQDLETQKEILEKEGCEKLFVEKVTGTSTQQRTQLKEAIEFVRKGDTLVVTKIDRLARSIMDLNKIVQELAQKGVKVKFIKEAMEFDGSNENNNSLQLLLFNILGSFAQFERDLIVERTTEGRERAKKQGKHMGRPGQDEKTLKRAIQLYYERNKNGMSVNEIVKSTGIPRSTLYAKVKQIN